MKPCPISPHNIGYVFLYWTSNSNISISFKVFLLEYIVVF